MYDIKVYEEGEEFETIRGLTDSQKDCLVAVFERHEIKYLVKEVGK